MANYTYEIFNEVAKQGSFARAAEILLLTPSAISHSIAGLEEELGFPLFTRNKKGVTLTGEGMLMLERVREILRNERLLKEEAAEIAGLARGSVTIAGFSSICSSWLPEIILSFRENYPDIEINVLQGDYEDIYNWVMTGQADLGFVSLRGTREVRELPIFTDTFQCVTPRGFTPANGAFVTAKELESLPVISPTRGYRFDLDNYAQKNRIRLHAHFSFTDDDPILSFVEKGLGIYFMPTLTAARLTYDVDSFPLEPPFQRTIGMILPKNTLPSPAVRALREEIDVFLKSKGL